MTTAKSDRINSWRVHCGTVIAPGHVRRPPRSLPQSNHLARHDNNPITKVHTHTGHPRLRSHMTSIMGATQSDAARTDIEVVLSGGPSLRRSVRPDDTLGALVDDLRRNGHLMGVSDIRGKANASLTTSDKWRQLKMGEISAASGQPLHITTFRPAAVAISKFVPGKKRSVLNNSVNIDKSQSVDILDAMLRQLSIDPTEPSTLSVQELTLYSRAGKTRRAVKSYNHQNPEYVFIDEITGKHEIDDQRTHFIMTFLSGASGLIASPSPSHFPVLELFTNCEVLSIDDTGHLRPAFPADLHFPSHLLLMQGIRKSDSLGLTLAMALSLCGGLHLDTDSSVVHEDEDAAAAAMSKLEGKLTQIFILASASSLLPQYSIPAGKTVHARTRSGWEVTVVGRRLRGRETTHESGSVWITTFEENDFDDQLTRAMTR